MHVGFGTAPWQERRKQGAVLGSTPRLFAGLVHGNCQLELPAVEAVASCGGVRQREGALPLGTCRCSCKVEAGASWLGEASVQGDLPAAWGSGEVAWGHWRRDAATRTREGECKLRPWPCRLAEAARRGEGEEATRRGDEGSRTTVAAGTWGVRAGHRACRAVAAPLTRAPSAAASWPGAKAPRAPWTSVLLALHGRTPAAPCKKPSAGADASLRAGPGPVAGQLCGCLAATATHAPLARSCKASKRLPIRASRSAARSQRRLSSTSQDTVTASWNAAEAAFAEAISTRKQRAISEFEASSEVSSSRRWTSSACLQLAAAAVCCPGLPPPTALG
mmetsp:Transcript_76682/g.248229  ORF Transcript_76682/g.248229 Transcript_76682/m.248229 type:complete len:334 (-) Transcript_76682:548-1549(-)